MGIGDFLSTAFGGKAEADAAARDRLIAQQYGTESQGYLKTGYDTGVTNLNKAVDAYTPLAEMGAKYGKAGDLWTDALGVNGPAGNQRGTDAFQTTPGFALTQKAALEGIDRRRAITGMYASGNADMETGDWITKNLYEQQYAPWMKGLQDAAGMGGQYTAGAAAGQAGGYGSLANLGQQYATAQTGVAGDVASGMTKASDLQASGEASGAKNLLGAGLSLANIGAGIATGGASTALTAGLRGMGGGGPIVPGDGSGPRPLYGRG